jgi:PPOX class probable F420-dependent enzyme
LTLAGRLYGAVMPISFNAETLRLLDGPNYAVLATINRDGSPHSSAMWVGREGDDLVFSTLEGRVKHRNMLRDPRVSVSVLDSPNPENYVELRGRVTMTPDPDRLLHIQLSHKYDGTDPGPDAPGRHRVIVRMVVEKVAGHAA